MTLDPRRRLLYGGLLALAAVTLWATQRLAPAVRAGRALDGREVALAHVAGGPLPDAAALADEVDRLRAALDARATGGAPDAGLARAPADRVMEAELALSDLAHAVGFHVEAFERADAPARPAATAEALDDGGPPPGTAPVRAPAHALAALPPATQADPAAAASGRTATPSASPSQGAAPGAADRPAARLVLRGDFFALRDLLDGLGGLPWAIAVERLDVTTEPDGQGGVSLRVELRVRA